MMSVHEWDACSKRGAERIASVIREWWKERGHTINVWVAESKARADRVQELYVVRSDLIRGKPRPPVPKHSPWSFAPSNRQWVN